MGKFRFAILLLLSSLLALLNVGPASADGSSISSGFEQNGVKIGADRWVVDQASGLVVHAAAGTNSADPNDYKYELQCHLGDGEFDLRCLGYQLKCEDRPDGVMGIPVVWLSRPRSVPGAVWSHFSGPTCLYDAKPADVLPLIAAEVQREFESLPVSPGVVVAQPSPNTLRGAATNFYAEAVVQEFDVVMFGQKVHVKATPVLYTWDYGDGSVFGPQDSMGGPLPQSRWGEETRTSHVYGATGDFRVVLTTSFSGTYSVNAGPPLPISSQGRFSSPPQTISVWRSLTRNYADDCLANPQGQGCPGAATQR